MLFRSAGALQISTRIFGARGTEFPNSWLGYLVPGARNFPTVSWDIWCPGHGISQQSAGIFGARARNFPTVSRDIWCPGHGISQQSAGIFGARGMEFPNGQPGYLVPGARNFPTVGWDIWCPESKIGIQTTHSRISLELRQHWERFSFSSLIFSTHSAWL